LPYAQTAERAPISCLFLGNRRLGEGRTISLPRSTPGLRRSQQRRRYRAPHGLLIQGGPGQPSTGPVRRRRRDERHLESAGRLVGARVVLPLLGRRLSLGRATGSTGPPRSTMTVSRESGRGLAAVSRERVPWKEPLQDTTRLCRVRKPSSSHTTINDFAKLGTALDGTPTIVGRLS